MSTKFNGKNLLFFEQNHKISKDFMNELEKNLLLKKQFLMFNKDDPNIKLPQIITDCPDYPVVIASGVAKPIFGENAVIWIRNNGFAEKSNGNLEYCNLGLSGALSGSIISDNLELMPNSNSSTNKYSALNEKSKTIETFEDSRPVPKDDAFTRKYENYVQQRNQDVHLSRGR